MRIHVISLPHTQTTHAFDWCAYTAKVRRLGGMLHSQGHEMILYSGPENEAICAEHVQVADPEDWFGGPWPVEKVFNLWDPDHPCWLEMGHRAIIEIEKRIQPRDVIGIIAGRCQMNIANHFAEKGHLIAEWGIGYEGILSNAHWCFESRAWQHYVYGLLKQGDGRNFDTVIPNAFDPADLIFEPEAKDDYILYLGRHTARKGMAVVGELAKDFRIITAGQAEGDDVPGAERRGIQLGQEKARLIANARAVIVPSLYIEPFGGINVEAMLSGTPVITTDFGAYPETVLQGVSGFRCNTLGEFQRACAKVQFLDRTKVREWADQFTVDNVAPRYDAWLQRLNLLYDKGWYQDAV